MIKIYIHLGLTICFALLLNSVSAQKNTKANGDIYFAAGRYTDALQAYKSYKKGENDPAFLIKRGIAHLYANDPNGCIKDMGIANTIGSDDNRKYKYTALAYMAKKEYSEAAAYFKMYLNTLKRNTTEWNQVVKEIKRCGYSQNYKFVDQMAFVENLGSGVNTVFDEFGPVQSPTRPERYYFSSAREGSTGGLRNQKGLADVLSGHYSADMYMVDLIDGNWSTVLTFGHLLNSPRHDILQDFSLDGSVVFYSRSQDKVKGALYTDTFSLEVGPEKLVGSDFPFKPQYGDNDLFIFSDSLIIFSSSQGQGYGGYDLYYAQKKDDIWQSPVNFGPQINTDANETAPYLIKSGNRLFFSSDRVESLGGYDIFEASFTDDGKVAKVSNLGYPINSPGNDSDIELSFDGMFALFSSDRVEGLGGQDIYIAYFKDQLSGQLDFALVPDFANSDVTQITSPTSNTSVNETKTPLPPAREYIGKPLYFSNDEDILSHSNLLILKSLVDLMSIYPEIKIDLYSHYISIGKNEFDLYFTAKRAETVLEYLIKSGIKPDRITVFGCGANYPLALNQINGIPSSLAEKVNKRIDIRLHAPKTSNINVLYDLPVVATQYRDTLWDHFNETNHHRVTFRVAFSTTAQMLKNDILINNPNVIIQKKADDGKYTYTMGNFSSYSDAQRLKNQLINNGFDMAMIIPYYDGAFIPEEDESMLRTQFAEYDAYLKAEQK
jgi:outer membrane protein OmpA-like peptidoglycan-associated protein